MWSLVDSWDFEINLYIHFQNELYKRGACKKFFLTASNKNTKIHWDYKYNNLCIGVRCETKIKLFVHEH